MSTARTPAGPDQPVVESKPKTIAQALQLLREDAKAAGTDKMTMEEIIEEIAAYRREKREQELAGQ